MAGSSDVSNSVEVPASLSPLSQVHDAILQICDSQGFPTVVIRSTSARTVNVTFPPNAKFMLKHISRALLENMNYVIVDFAVDENSKVLTLQLERFEITLDDAKVEHDGGITPAVKAMARMTYEL